MDILSFAKQLVATKINPDMIYLDIKNPRFAGEKDLNIDPKANPLDEKLQEIIRKFILEKHELMSLVDSIRRVGFLCMDRIVVKEYSGKYIVLEGNRRVAAIKTLLALEEQRQVMLAAEVKDTIKEIEALVLKLDDNEYDQATWFLQGIRHISGVRGWGPFQQAELINTLIKSGMNFTDAGEAIGAGRKRTAQMLRAYKGLMQMKENPDYGDKWNPDLFSHFEQAWAKQDVRSWLDWDHTAGVYKNDNNLLLFYKWITEGIDKVEQKKIKAEEIREKLPYVLACDTSRKS